MINITNQCWVLRIDKANQNLIEVAFLKPHSVGVRMIEGEQTTGSNWYAIPKKIILKKSIEYRGEDSYIISTIVSLLYTFGFDSSVNTDEKRHGKYMLLWYKSISNFWLGRIKFVKILKIELDTTRTITSNL